MPHSISVGACVDTVNLGAIDCILRLRNSIALDNVPCLKRSHQIKANIA